MKRQIPIRTFADWTEVRPGFMEMELVAHCGWGGADQFLYKPSMFDVATGWVARADLRDKRQETVFHALQRIQAGLPFRVLGLDSDNHTEFVNRTLLRTAPITFTRTRRHLKNETCLVEQKKWAVVRRLVGYDRLKGAEVNPERSESRVAVSQIQRNTPDPVTTRPFRTVRSERPQAEAGKRQDLITDSRAKVAQGRFRTVRF